MPEFKVIEAPAGSLKNHESMIIVQLPDSPLFFEAFAFSKDSGFTGGMIMIDRGTDPSDIFVALDSGIMPADGHVWPVTDTPCASWVTQAITKSGRSISRTDASPIAVANYIANHMHVDTVSFLKKAPDLCNSIDKLNFFATGDVEARRQAAAAMPISANHFITDRSVAEAIDARGSLKDAVRAALKISPADMKRWMKVEKLASDHLAGNDATSFTYEKLRRSGVADEARRFGALNSAQFPKTLDQCLHAHDYFSRSSEVQRYLRIGPAPFERHRQFVADDGWLEAQKTILRPTQEIRDYLSRVDTVMTSVIIAGTVRDKAPGFLDRMSVIAEKVWQDIPVEPYEAEALKSYTHALRNAAGRGQKFSILEEFGEYASFKQIREFSERWHHIQQTMDNGLVQTVGNVEWQPLVERVDLGGGLIARELTSSDALRRQGDIEQHCVGDYTSQILRGSKAEATLIFSLESEDKILSTVEVTMVAKKAARGLIRGNADVEIHFRVDQHKARRNREPGKLACRGEVLLLEHLNALSTDAGLSYLKEMRVNPSSLRDTLSRMTVNLKANMTNPELPEMALATYEEVLPKELRGRTWSDWSATCEKQSCHVADSATIIAKKAVEIWDTFKAEEQILSLTAEQLTCD